MIPSEENNESAPGSAPNCEGCNTNLPSGWKGHFCPRCLLGSALEGVDEEAETIASHPGDRLVHDFAEETRESSETGELRIGPYLVVRALGAGGMGTVYLAEQNEPVKRKVAVKVMRSAAGSAELLARFEAERQALAIMSHPSIAKVFDAGITAEGAPYFVMEWVRGENVTKYCDTHHLSVEDRIRLFLQICSGIQHAHEKGVIHRDIKPSNLLVEEVDGKPVPKIIDFGVAKAFGEALSEDAVATLDGQLMGTPEYMSPEQAEGKNREVDVRSDVYSLGVVLYELLTGTTPIAGGKLREAGLLEMGRLIRETKVGLPSARLPDHPDTAVVAANRNTRVAVLRRELQGDLDWILLKALRPEREERYHGAAQLADDLERHLHSEPVEASPPSILYRVRKFARRHRAFFYGSAAVAIAVLLGAVAAVSQAIRATHSEQLGACREQAARARTLVETDPGEALRQVLGAAERDRDLRRGGVSDTILSDLLHILDGAREVQRLDVSAAGGHLAIEEAGRMMAIGNGSEVRLIDATSGYQRTFQALPRDEVISSLAFTGDKLLAGTADGDLFVISADLEKVIRKSPLHETKVILADFLSGSEMEIVSVDETGTVAISAPDGEILKSIDAGIHSPGFVRAVANPAKKRLVLLGDPLLGSPVVLFVDLVSGEARVAELEDRGLISDLAISSDGDQVFGVDLDGIVRRWNWSGQPLGVLSAGRVEKPVRLALHPWFPVVFLGYSDGEIRSLTWEGGVAFPLLRGHRNRIRSLGFAADSSRLVSLADDSTLRSWDLLGLQAMPPLRLGEKSESALYSPDGSRLAIGATGGRVRVFDTKTRKELSSDLSLEGRCDHLIRLSDDTFIAATS